MCKVYVFWVTPEYYTYVLMHFKEKYNKTLKQTSAKVGNLIHNENNFRLLLVREYKMSYYDNANKVTVE